MDRCKYFLELLNNNFTFNSDAELTQFIQDNLVLTPKSLMRQLDETLTSLGFLSPQDKVVYGHNTIGKSFLYATSNSNFVSLDDDYKDVQNAYIDLHKLPTETRQDYKARHPEDYNDLLKELW